MLVPPEPSRASICAIVPLIESAEVPDPETTAPLSPADAFNTPSPAERVTVRELPPASTSWTDRLPSFRFSGLCSVAA